MAVSGVSAYSGIYGASAAQPASRGREAEVKEGREGCARKLTDEERTEVEKLEKRDQEVRAHEMAHVAAGGQYTQGGASFEYQTGPDGKRYAVGGEVGIDTSAVSGDPQATIQKMRVIRKAALAPANPSAQDRAVAAKAAQQETKAQMELQKSRRGEGEDGKAAHNPSGPKPRTISYSPSGMTIAANLDAGGAVNLTA